jgi:hypothetical protein
MGDYMQCGDGPLLWAQRNRTRTERARSAGALVTHLADGLVTGEIASVKAAAAMIAPLVDDEFRRHCRVASADGGSMVVHVDEPGLVGAMRLRWSGPLQAALVGSKSRRGARRVFFEWGRAGADVR